MKRKATLVGGLALAFIMLGAAGLPAGEAGQPMMQKPSATAAGGMAGMCPMMRQMQGMMGGRMMGELTDYENTRNARK